MRLREAAHGRSGRCMGHAASGNARVLENQGHRSGSNDGLLRVRHNVEQVVAVSLDQEVKAPTVFGNVNYDSPGPARCRALRRIFWLGLMDGANLVPAVRVVYRTAFEPWRERPNSSAEIALCRKGTFRRFWICGLCAASERARARTGRDPARGPCACPQGPPQGVFR